MNEPTETAPVAVGGAENETLFRRLVESVREYAIFMLDPTGRITSWNVGAHRIKGYSADEIIGRHFSVFYGDEDVRAGLCELELEIASREGRFEGEGWRLRKDGSRFWANVVISAMRGDAGELLGFSKVTRDLTEYKHAQEEQAARMAAEQANRAKDEFLAILGHELRNPLAPIVTALELMKLRGECHTSKEQATIERHVKHMVQLVDDLLDVSRIARGKIELKKQRIDARDPVADAIEVAGPLIERRGQRLQLDVPQHPIAVHGDRARLTQVFANLLLNAAKYTPVEGNIGLKVNVVAREVVFEVSDDGSGIEPTLLPMVFDLFVQGRQGMERSNGGLGLGLALTRTLVKLHGGVVTAKSAGAAMGSTFTVRLPLATTSVSSSPRTGVDATPPPVLPKRHILLVDDNEDAIDLLGDMLSMMGQEVRTASDAAAALAVVKDFVPDVAILDIGLPVMNGYELASHLRAALAPATPQLIALSGYGSDSDLERSRRAGFHAHLIKPVELGQLVEVLQSPEVTVTSS